MTYKRFWINFLSTSQKISFPEKESSLLHFHFICSIIWTLLWLAAKLWTSKTMHLPQKVSDKPPITPKNFLISSDSALLASHCMQTIVSQPYPQLSKVFDHPLNDKALKTQTVFASQHYSYSQELFVIAQSTTFIAKKLWRHTFGNISQSGIFAQGSSSANIYKKYQFWKWTYHRSINWIS